MEINPYDNFDNWSCILLSTLQCSQDYVDLIADCTDLMFSIISENQLPEPITTYTNKFLNYVIPEATTSLLKILDVKNDEIETCISFLSTSLTLCTWGVQNNVESLFKLPPLILDQYQFFYHQKKDNWKTIMDNFLSSGDMNLICDIMMSNDPSPPLGVYILVAQIILVFFRNNLYEDVLPYVEKFIIAFGNYLRSIMDLQTIRNIDKNVLDNILCDFYKILADTSFDHIFDLSSYYEFLEFCLKSDILFIQLFITKNFRYFLIYAKDEIIIQFSEWCNKKDFIKYLISKDFNEEIIKQLVPIFEILADKDLLNRNTLYILWNRTLHVHTSLRSSYINLISRILRNMKSKDAKNYLTKIMINGNKDINEIDMNFDDDDDNIDDDDDESNTNLIDSQENLSFDNLQKVNDANVYEMDTNNEDKVYISDEKVINNKSENYSSIEPSSNSKETDINNDNDANKSNSNAEPTSSSNEINNKTDSSIEYASNSNEIDKKDNSSIEYTSNSNEIDKKDNSSIEYTSNSNETSNKNNSNIEYTSNSNEINNKNDSSIEYASNSNEISNKNDSSIEYASNSNEINSKSEDIVTVVDKSNSNDNCITEKSTSEEAYYNHYNIRYDFMTIQKYNDICDQLSHINLDFHLTNDLLQLLLGCLSTSKPNVSYYIITVLFEFSKKDEKIANEFSKSIVKKWSNKIKMFLFYKCFDQIENKEEDHHISTLILPKLIDSIGYNIDLGRDFEKRLFDSLPYDRTLIYSIISEYYQGNSKLLPLKRIINMYGDYNNLDDEFWSFMQSLLDTNGIIATTDNGFEVLKECINNFDFRKATTKFVYFLKSYYLVINLYENKMKTDDFYKQVIKGKIIFIKSEEPPIGLNQFFRLLELTEDDHVASIAANIILLFTTSYETFQCDDTIDIIKNIILPKIKSKELNPKLINRYLNVLYNISVSSELSIHLIDYNYPKHSIYDKDIILLDINGLGVHQIMICDIHDTFNNIQDRLKDAYSFLKKERIFFNLNGSLVCDENSFLETYKLDKNKYQFVKISVYQSEEFKNIDNTKNILPNCPSLFLTEQGFQNLLLSFYDNDELCQTVNQFLSFLPNDPDTIKLIESQEILVSLLMDCNNSYISQYYLQILISILKIIKDEEIINQFKNVDFCTYLYQFLENHENCSYEIISILKCLFSLDLEPIINDIIKIVCNILSADKMNLLGHLLSETKYIASQLFYTILSQFPEINIFAENPTLLESVVSNATIETWQFIRNGLFKLTDVLPLFDNLVNHIEKGNNSRYFAELFTAFVPRVSNECNVSKILDMCIDLLSSAGVFEDAQSLISICEMASSILNSNKETEFNNNLEAVISKTLPVALKTDDTNIQSAIYDLCQALAPHIPNGQDKINQIMKSVYEIETDRWNYKPENFKKSSTGFVGLTNLGATCYMNSVLQQLFFFRTFRDSVFTETFESKKEGKEAFLEFKKIFAHLLLSKKSFAETRPFCNIWIGWDKKTINVREQQDAVEFLNMFLDQLPETLQKSYRGTIINQIEGISEEFKSTKIENFYAFSLEIKNFSTIEESFDNFLQDELFTGENQIYADTLERKIDARKYSRIQTAPPVLILHLKRFGYDIRTFIRNKIYSRFIIPQTINIEKLLENGKEMIYKLKGVVVHFGNANGGHYTSIIKIDGNFYDFNDMNVSSFNENDFEEETFGGNQMSNCAYLLFYERIDIVNEKEIDVEIESNLIDQKIREEIEKENEEFIRCQIAFTKPTMHFASYCNDVQQMTDYFINIFIHSELGDESHIIFENLKNCILENYKQKWYIKHMNDIFKPKIEDFFSNCSNDNIITTFIDIISTIIDSSNVKLENKKQEDNSIEEESNEISDELVFNIDAELFLSLYNFVSLIINYIPNIKQWRQYKYIFTIPYLFLKLCNLNILLKGVYKKTKIDEKVKIIVRDQESQEEITNKFDISSWCNIITNIIVSFYKENNSEVILENVDFSKALKIFQFIYPIGEESPIMEYYNKIILSKVNINSFFVFALKTKQSKFDVESGFAYFYNENFSYSDSKYFIQYAKNVLTLTDFNAKFYLFDQEHLSNTNDIINMFSKQINEKNNLRLRTNLIRNYVSYVFPFLTSDFSIFSRENAAHFTLDLFPNLITIDEIGKSYSSYNKNTNVHPPTETQLDELKLIWNQLFDQVEFILTDPKKFISNYSPDKIYKPNDFLCLQFFYILKWLQMFLQLKDQKELEVFINLFNSFDSLNISNNSNLPVLAHIITSYPIELWINESFHIIKESLKSLAVSLNEKNLKQILDIFDKLPNEKIDEIFNNEECLETLINFFKIQNYSAKYNTFPLITRYLSQNPNKIDRFCVIFDNFNPDTFHENMNCILNVPEATIPFDVAFSVLLNVINFLAHSEVQYYECRRTLEVFSSLKRHFLSYKERFKTDFDFKIIDYNTMDHFIEMMSTFSYSSNEIDDLVDLICIDNDVRKLFYDIIHRVLSQQYLYNATHLAYLSFYLNIIKKYGNNDENNQELVNEIEFVSEEMINTIEGKSSRNFLNSKNYDFIIENGSKDIMKKLVISILNHIDIIKKFDPAFEPFVTKMIQTVGIDDIKLIVDDICNTIIKETTYNYDISEMYQCNLALIIEIFPEIFQLIKDKYPSVIPDCSQYLNSRVRKAFYPNEK